MTDFFTAVGFGCCLAVTVLLTLYVVTWLIHAITVKTIGWLRMFRFLWRFYSSISPSKFARGCRYHLGLYDKTAGKFVRVESLNDEYLSEAEYERVMAEFKEQSKRGKDDEAE